MAGYSGTPLPRKLGIATGHRVLLAGAPTDFDLDVDGAVDVHRRAGRTPYDVIVAFCPDRATMLRRFADLARRTTTSGSLWIAWPKKSSGVATDLDENVVRGAG